MVGSDVVAEIFIDLFFFLMRDVFSFFRKRRWDDTDDFTSTSELVMLRIMLATVLAGGASAYTASPAAAVQQEQEHTAVGLEVEHATEPLTVDTASPRFSWKLSHPQRAQRQLSFRVVVTMTTTAAGPGDVVWDSGAVASNATHVLYPGAGAGARVLPSDTDFSWSVVWADATGSPSRAATSTFSTALLGGVPDWHGAEWLSSSGNGSLNLYRAVLPELGAEPPRRARLYIASPGYYHATLNGVETDSHLLGPQSTFHVRALYDAWDVTALLRGGCNTLGVALGNGWGSSTHSGGNAGRWDRQFIAMLSVTTANGTVIRIPTALTAPAVVAPGTPGSAVLLFRAGAGDPACMIGIY